MPSPCPSDSRRFRPVSEPHRRAWRASFCSSATEQTNAEDRSENPSDARPSPPPAPIPAWARASGRAGEGDPLFAAGAGLALLDAFLRADPPAAGALHARLALKSAAASAKILRVNADEGALRDLRFASANALGPAANLLSLWRDVAGRPPSLDPGRILDAAARLDLALLDPNGLASSLKALFRGGRSGFGGRKGRSRSPFPPPRTLAAAEAEILALWAFDMVIAIRLRWPRPVPLIATENPSIQPCDPRAPDDGQCRATQPG